MNNEPKKITFGDEELSWPDKPEKINDCDHRGSWRPLGVATTRSDEVAAAVFCEKCGYIKIRSHYGNKKYQI